MISHTTNPKRKIIFCSLRTKKFNPRGKVHAFETDMLDEKGSKSGWHAYSTHLELTCADTKDIPQFGRCKDISQYANNKGIVKYISPAHEDEDVILILHATGAEDIAAKVGVIKQALGQEKEKLILCKESFGSI